MGVDFCLRNPLKEEEKEQEEEQQQLAIFKLQDKIVYDFTRTHELLCFKRYYVLVNVWSDVVIIRLKLKM